MRVITAAKPRGRVCVPSRLLLFAFLSSTGAMVLMSYALAEKYRSTVFAPAPAMVLPPSAQPPLVSLLDELPDDERGHEDGAAEGAAGEGAGNVVRAAGGDAGDALLGRKLLFLAPRDDGFSNQRITVAEALRCAALSGRVAVLPLIYSDVRYGTKPKGPFLFRDYFDLGALAAAQVVSFASPDAAAAAGVRCEIVAPPSSPKRALNAAEYLFGWRRSYTAPGEHVSPAAPCVTQAVCPGSFQNEAHFGRYSDLAAAGQGYNMLANENFRRIRSALRPSSEVSALADTVLKTISGGAFNAIHLRRTDFRKKCKMQAKDCKQFGADAFFQPLKMILQGVDRFANQHLPLFVATEDVPWAQHTLGPALTERGITMVLATDAPLPPTLTVYSDRVDMRSFATQIIASRAEEFIGNRFSSFSSEIWNERLLNNKTETKWFW